MSYKLTTVAACRVAGIDRQRFNEFVANGDYLCAPKTIPGRSRLFDEGDLIALTVFAKTVAKGARALSAGLIADAVRKGLYADPDAEVIKIGNDIGGTVDLLLSKDKWFDNAPVARQRFISITTYNIALLRERIREKIDAKRSIIGPEDHD